METERRSEETLDTSYHERRRTARLADPHFREEYERAQIEIRQVDEVMRSLDRLRQEVGLTKADLAREIGKNPASVRRLFTSESNPELRTVAAMAAALGARLEVVRQQGGSRRRHRRAATA
ncbi:MAG TPA: helix-turn-helix transcriptional regulator [Actinomycetota bacterium]|jgi:DNA-binding phage protein